MPQKLPSGRYRGRVRHPVSGKQISPQKVLGGPASYDDEDAARTAEQEAAAVLRSNAERPVTLAEFYTEWSTDPEWTERRSKSSRTHMCERIGRFVALYGGRTIRSIDDELVSEFLRADRSHKARVSALCTFFNDAMRPEAGRLVAVNPFSKLGFKKGKGRKHVQPPSEVDAARLIALADEVTPPSFAAYLHFAIYEGTRPGENDGLRVQQLDFDAGTVLINQQWNVKAREMTLPKHGHIREITLTDPARERLLTLPLDGEFAFTSLTGNHFTPSTRDLHWNRVRCVAGLGNVSLYTCTRHYFAWYAWNVKRLSPEDIAEHFGHQDGGKLVRELYGHFDSTMSRARIRKAFAEIPQASAAVPLRRVS